MVVSMDCDSFSLAFCVRLPSSDFACISAAVICAARLLFHAVSLCSASATFPARPALSRSPPGPAAPGRSACGCADPGRPTRDPAGTGQPVATLLLLLTGESGVGACINVVLIIRCCRQRTEHRQLARKIGQAHRIATGQTHQAGRINRQVVAQASCVHEAQRRAKRWVLDEGVILLHKLRELLRLGDILLTLQRETLEVLRK